MGNDETNIRTAAKVIIEWANYASFSMRWHSKHVNTHQILTK